MESREFSREADGEFAPLLPRPDCRWARAALARAELRPRLVEGVDDVFGFPERRGPPSLGAEVDDEEGKDPDERVDERGADVGDDMFTFLLSDWAHWRHDLEARTA
jgi:hypothetical protein